MTMTKTYVKSTASGAGAIEYNYLRGVRTMFDGGLGSTTIDV